MQAVKEKLQDMNALRKVKAEARAEEKAEKEIAKARMDVAHEVRLAKEAEATMDLHVAKAGERVEKEISKHTSNNLNDGFDDMNPTDAGTTETTNGHTYIANRKSSCLE